jgi:uncharacterized integral membrane protein
MTLCPVPGVLAPARPSRPGEQEGIAMQYSEDDGTGSEGGQRARLGGGAIASIVGGGALLVFMLQNTEDVTVTFLFWDFTWPVWLLVLVAALVGALVWFGLGVLRRHRRRVERRQERRD